MQATAESTAVKKIRQLQVTQIRSNDTACSRETLAEIGAVAELLDLSTEHGNRPLDGNAALGLAQLLRETARHVEREYSRLYRAQNIEF